MLVWYIYWRLLTLHTLFVNISALYVNLSIFVLLHSEAHCVIETNIVHFILESSDDVDHPDSGSHYLHPSLLSTNSQQAVGFIQVKTLKPPFNRDSFLVVIVINDLRFIEMWTQMGLNKNFYYNIRFGVFFPQTSRMINDTSFSILQVLKNDVLYLYVFQLILAAV